MYRVNKSKSSKRQKLIYFGLATLIVLIPISGFIYFALSFPDFKGIPHLSDAQMLTNFQKYKSEFERLKLMIIEDQGLTRIDDDWTEPSDPQTIGIKTERITEYRKIFQRLGIPRGISATAERDRIEFIASSLGWVASGSSKSYAYLKTPPDKLLDNLDKMSLQEKPVGTGHRHIEGNWYLFFYGD